MAVRTLLPTYPGEAPCALGLDLAAEAARAERSFLLLLPGRQERDAARVALARRLGGSDPRWVSGFGGLARRVLGPKAARIASERERDAFLAQALSELPGVAQTLALRYRGFRRGLLHVFRELEQNGLSEAELERHLEGARLDPRRAGRLNTAYAGYRARLRPPKSDDKRLRGEHRLTTEADLLQSAGLELSRTGAEPLERPLPALLIVAGFSELSPRQLAFLGALAARPELEEVRVCWPEAPGLRARLAFEWPEQTREVLSASLEFERSPRVDPGLARPPALRRLAAELYAPHSAGLTPDEAQALTLVRAASREDEIELALTQLRAWTLAAPGRGWRDALIVVPDLQRYRDSLTRAAGQLKVPLRVEGHVPLSSSPSCQGALALLEAAARFDLGPLLVAAACPALGLSVDEADRLTRAARRRGLPVLGSAERWRSLGRQLGGPAGSFLLEAAELGLTLEEACEEELERAERAAYEESGDFTRSRATTRGAAGAIRRSLERILQAASLRGLGDSPSAAQVSAAASEVAAQRELLALLADLDRLGAPLYGEGEGASTLRPPEQLVARIAEEVRAARCYPRDARHEVVSVVDVRGARSRSAELVLILGLVEREFPRPPNEDQFLPEATRRALSGRKLSAALGADQRLRLPTASDRAAEDRYRFYAAAAAARSELWLLYPGFTPHGSPRAPSRFLSDVEALLSPAARAARTLLRSPGELVADQPGLLLTPGGLRCFAYRRVSAVARPKDPGQTALGLALFAQLLRDPYERARLALSLGRPEAKVPARLEPALARVYSSSELESFATCPFRHFVRYLIGARPVDDLAQSGLDALRRGRVVHDALERIYRDGDDPERAFEQEFTRGIKDLDVGMEEDAFRRQALSAILAFVREDDPSFRSAGHLQPWQFELPFGPETDAGALLVPAPALRGTIQLRGQIDRVDLVPLPSDAPEGQRRAGFVTDYKLGGLEVDGQYLDALHKGSKLQIPLYLLALLRVFEVRPLGAAFAALGTRRRTGVIEPEVGARWEPGLDEERVALHKVALDRTLERAEDHVRRIVTGIAQGLIAPSPDDAQDCLRCEAQDACRVDRDQARRIARRGRPLPILPPQAFLKA